MKKNQSQSSGSLKDKRPPIQPIPEIETQHPDEWIVVEITRMAEDGFTPLEGRLMASGKDRNDVHKRAMQYRDTYGVHNTYQGYTGQMQVESVLL